MEKKARAFCFTVIGENYVERFDTIKSYLVSLKTCDYVLAGKETAPETGSKHYQCYCHFKNAIRIKEDIYKLARWFPAKGTPEQNYDYCTKEDDTPFEWGTMPQENKLKRIKDLKEASQEELDNAPIQYYNIIEKYNQNKANELTIDDIGRKPIEVYYISGDPGYGKTEIAELLMKKWMLKHNIEIWNDLKYQDGFWHGVSKGAKVAIYDDFRDSHMKPSEFINFVDYKKHNMNIKGGSLKNFYNFIVITSVQDLMSIYYDFTQKNEEPAKQWQRRIKSVKLLREYKPEEYEEFINNNFNI